MHKSEERGLPQVKDLLNSTNPSYPTRKKSIVNNISVIKRMKVASYGRLKAGNHYNSSQTESQPIRTLGSYQQSELSEQDTVNFE